MCVCVSSCAMSMCVLQELQSTKKHYIEGCVGQREGCFILFGDFAVLCGRNLHVFIG